MALKDEIVPFIDCNGLVSPSVYLEGHPWGSDNGPMFTAEYYVMLKKLGQLTDQDAIDFNQKISQCITPEGLLCRVPIGKDDGLEGPDDQYGVLNGCMQLGITKIPRGILWCLIRYFGCLNNESPGTWTIKSFLARQSQLIACLVAASFPSWKNPLHIAIRFLFFPWFLYAAIGIAIAGMGQDLGNADYRRLPWHVWQTLKPVSLTCWLAGKIFTKRLYSQYPTGMRGVAELYYQKANPVHPFIEYWVTE